MTTAESHRATLERFVAQYPDRADLRRQLLSLRLQAREMLGEEEMIAAFPAYPGLGEMHSFMVDAYLDANRRNDFAHIELPTTLLIDLFPACPVSLYFRASVLFHSNRRAEAIRSIEARLGLARHYDYLAQLYTQMLWHDRRSDEARSFIGAFFETYDGDLWRTPGFSARQAPRIADGIPPILIATLPKSGSLFLLNTLMRGLSIPSTYLCPVGLYIDMMLKARLDDFAKGGCIAVDHLLANDANMDRLYDKGIRKIVFHYRDIRQSTISHIHQSVSDEIVASPRELIMRRRNRIEKDFESEYRVFFKEWLGFLETWADRILTDGRFEFLVTNFDDLEDDRQLIGRILDFHAIPGGKFDWTVLDTDHRERAGHFRKGLKDEWRDVLSPALQDEVEALLAASPAAAKLQSFRI